MACSKAEEAGAVQCGPLTAPSRICKGCSSGVSDRTREMGTNQKRRNLGERLGRNVMGGEDLAAQGGRGCPSLGSFQSQVGQPGPVGGVPAHGCFLMS